MSNIRNVLRFKSGTLLFDGAELPGCLNSCFIYDPRTLEYRARGCDYRRIMELARANGVDLCDEASAFEPVKLNFVQPLIPRPHQDAAYAAWKRNKWRGIVALPTGGGKSFLAAMAIRKLQRPALILVPTIDLLLQWHSLLKKLFGVEIGMLGGGEKRVLPITVSTYDSAVIYMEELGGSFALLICDECHHLPGAVYRTAAEQSIAPYRLGLSATPELDPDPERLMRLYELLGDIIYRVEVAELEGETLAPYMVKSVVLELTGKEKEEYECHRAVYRDFAVRNRIDFGKDSGWRDFLIAVSRRPDGRRAFLSYLRQRELSRRGAAKLAAVWRILCRHRDERILIFTADNAMAYEIGRTFCFPVITHSTKAVERKSWLDGFREGIYPVLVASRVLNEGVDVPEASIGIVVSGSGSVREHVQRLGRILRGRPGKQAILYELVNSGTAEVYAMKRRRGHSAYRGKTRS